MLQDIECPADNERYEGEKIDEDESLIANESSDESQSAKQNYKADNQEQDEKNKQSIISLSSSKVRLKIEG